MPRYDFRSPRLFIDAPLSEGATLMLDAAQAHYLADVLRLKPGGSVLVFNGRDGEWRATLDPRRFPRRRGGVLRRGGPRAAT